VSLEKVSSLLQLTFGVQKRASVAGQGPVVLKTSPSGGARHAVEAYVLATNIKGLGKGAYHYDANTHQLVDLERIFEAEALLPAVGNQYWFMPAGAFVVMTAVFERAMWRYPFNRAYRSVLTEAGHLGQTFCLVATALNLAPFCTMAFRDREIEAMIGVDGVSESAMYIVGVGTRPKGRVAHPGRIPPTAR
jgi:SagB-type dehydrogenase family enzyme